VEGDAKEALISSHGTGKNFPQGEKKGLRKKEGREKRYPREE